jgi:nicotinamidase-related amidase
MQRAFGKEIPETVAEMCRPDTSALLVCDAQVGLMSFIQDRERVIERSRSMLDVVRSIGRPVIYVRLITLPPAWLGVGDLRMFMDWQRQDQAADVQSQLPVGAQPTRIVGELAPEPGEPVFDKLGLSAFTGTPVDYVLRTSETTTVLIVGSVMEWGIEATARHAGDLGFLPVVVADACGSVDEQAAEQSLTNLDYLRVSWRCQASECVAALRDS